MKEEQNLLFFCEFIGRQINASSEVEQVEQVEQEGILSAHARAPWCVALRKLGSRPAPTIGRRMNVVWPRASIGWQLRRAAVSRREIFACELLSSGEAPVHLLQGMAGEYSLATASTASSLSEVSVPRPPSHVCPRHIRVSAQASR